MGDACKRLELRRWFRCVESVLNKVQKQAEVWKFESLEIRLKLVMCLRTLKSIGGIWRSGVWECVVIRRRTIPLWRKCDAQKSGRERSGHGIWRTRRSVGCGGRLNGRWLDGRPGFFANQKLERLVVRVLNRDDQVTLFPPPLQLLLAWEIRAGREVSSSGAHPKAGRNAQGLTWAVLVEELGDVVQDVHGVGLCKFIALTAAS